MLKKIAPKYSGMRPQPQVPMTERIKRLMERLHAGGPLWPYNDEATVKECIKRGLIRKGRARRHSRWSHNVLVPLVAAPEVVIPRVPQPYARRLADLDAAGLKRRVSSTSPRAKAG